MSFFRDYLHAVRASTRGPVSAAFGHWLAPQEPAPPTSGAHLPGVGWLVGIVACAVFAMLGLLLPPSAPSGLAAAVGSTMATLWITGGVNERGLYALSERTSSLGALPLLLIVMSKLSLLAVLAALAPAAVLVALLCAQVLSRFWPLFLTARTSRNTLLVAAGWTLAALALGTMALGAAPMAAGLLLSAAVWWLLRRWFGSRTVSADEATGTTQQLCEVAVYLGVAIAAR